MWLKLLRIGGILLAGYVILCGYLFFIQERIIFFPEKLDQNHTFSFPQPFEEIFIRSFDDTLLHGLLFTVKEAKGLVFYLHGNAGSVDSWGNVNEIYRKLWYDMFILDYRGYGKSNGNIQSQDQLLRDIQVVYEIMKRRYSEDKIVVVGVSIGTWPAAKIACSNKPKFLILQSPYYSLTDMMRRVYPFIPSFLLHYPLETFHYIKECTAPIIIFHGVDDKVIPSRSSVELKKHLRPQDKVIFIPEQWHNGIDYTEVYQTEIASAFEKVK